MLNEDFEKCLAGWILPATMPGERYVAQFRWEYSKGWVWMLLSGPEILIKILNPRDCCSYGCKGGPSD